MKNHGYRTDDEATLPSYEEFPEQTEAYPQHPGPYPHSVVVPPIGPDELPPPYTPPGASLSVNCKVCQNIVPIDGKQNQNVVKCGFCNEATPIKAPPPGKKYVRCPCNCLLICRATAVKIACPRTNCKRIITLGGTGGLENVTLRPPNANRVKCVHCGEVFLFAIQRAALARCTCCRRMSSVDPSYLRIRVGLYILLGLIFLGAGVGVTVGTMELASQSGGIYTVWIGAFVIGVLFLVRAGFLGSIRTSTVLGPA